MRSELFDYELPAAAIAQEPAAEREAARMLVLGRGDAPNEHRRISDLAELVPAGSLVVVNDTRVRPARLLGTRRGTGGRVELLLLGERPATAADATARDAGSPGSRGGDERLFKAVGHASKRLRVGALLDVPPLEVEVRAVAEDGELLVAVRGSDSLDATLERVGHVPLPPYVRRGDGPLDRERYQTVYARALGSAAAPTAGLHLTRPLLERLVARGVELGALTLHVGLGTFRPVLTEDLDQHRMHAEEFEVSEALAEAVRRTRARGGRVVAIGTTVVRALESAADPAEKGLVRPFAGETRLLLQPGASFRVVDALLTNFHVPRSTLLALVAAFAGRERVLAAYREALAEGYRFLSYGDAMWLGERAD